MQQKIDFRLSQRHISAVNVVVVAVSLFPYCLLMKNVEKGKLKSSPSKKGKNSFLIGTYIQMVRFPFCSG